MKRWWLWRRELARLRRVEMRAWRAWRGTRKEASIAAYAGDLDEARMDAVERAMTVWERAVAARRRHESGL